MTDRVRQLSPRQQELLGQILRDRVRRRGPSIPRQPRTHPARFPLTFAQRRLWLHDQLEPGGTEYNVPLAWYLDGPLDAGRVRAALRQIVSRHEVLRTRFPVVDGEPVQQVEPATDVRLEYDDLSRVGAADRPAALLAVLGVEAGRLFRLADAPPVRFRLVRLGTDEHVLMVHLHHIICDGWSAEILRGELHALLAASPAALTEPPIQYADYACWQHQNWESGAGEEGLAFWRRHLADAPAALDLPTARPRPHRPGPAGASAGFTVPATVASALRALARDTGTSLSTVLLTTWQVLLGRHAGQNDVVVGTAAANRPVTEVEPLIGFFVNMLPMRARFTDALPFDVLLRRNAEAVAQALRWQHVPFELLVDRLNPRRAGERHPLFQVSFALQNVPSSPATENGVGLRPCSVPEHAAPFDVGAYLVEHDDVIIGSLVYRTELFDAATMQRMARHWLTMLAAVTEAPGTPVGALPLVRPGGAQAEPGFGGAEHPPRLPGDDDGKPMAGPPGAQGATWDDLAEVVRGWAATIPDGVAVAAGNRCLTYRELDDRAQELAGRLVAAGVGAERVVGVALRDELDRSVALLAAAYAGAAGCVVDPEVPAEQATALLGPGGARLTDLLSFDAGAAPGDPARSPGPADIFAVYLTTDAAGTRQPIGASRLAWASAVQWLVQGLPLASGDAVLRTAPLSTATGLLDVWWAWASGGVSVAPAGGHRSEAAMELLRRSGVAAMHCSSRELAALLDAHLRAGRPDQTRLRHVVCPGEPVAPALARRFFDQFGADLYEQWDAGGLPTHLVPLAADGSRTVTVPGPGRWARVLDSADAAVQPGLVGRRFAGGTGLPREYRADPALTAARLVPDPDAVLPGSRRYRTEELVRRSATGELVRVGPRLYLHGRPIDVNRLESALMEEAGVSDSAVVLRDGAGGPELVGYVVASGDCDVDPAELARRLALRLPDDTLPTALVAVDALPLTADGDPDRTALAAARSRPAAPARAAAPATATERAVAALWAEVLDAPVTDVEANFFDLGGHSLKAAQVLNRVRTTFGTELPLRVLFQARTVRGLARLLDSGAAANAAPVTEPAVVPLATGNSGPPLLFCPPIGGTVFCYTDLVRALPAGREAWGIEAAMPAVGSLEEIAARQAEACLARRPAACVVAGWSMGGVLALEVARRLRSEGVEVPLVVVLDALPPIGRPVVQSLRSTLASLDELRTRWAQGPVATGQLGAASLELLAGFGLGERQLADLAHGDLLRLAQVWRHHLWALSEHRPRAYHGRVALFLARHNPPPLQRAITATWRLLCPDGLDVRPVDGAHLTLLQPPLVDHLGLELGDVLAGVTTA
jgi:non-ribosomal peptide synthetase component F/thioesterase domain-containing protein/acyl carrier protein